MKKILILSDSHGYFDDAIARHAKNHDEIWHGGDWGDIALYDKLCACGVVKGVYGNIDGAELRTVCPEFQYFNCEDVPVLMTHIGGYPGRYKPAFVQKIRIKKPKLVICGHSHILKVMYDKSLEHLHINPGAIGISGFHQVRTMVSLEIDGADMRNLKVIEFEK